MLKTASPNSNSPSPPRRRGTGWLSTMLLQVCVLLFFVTRLEKNQTPLEEAQAISQWGGMGHDFDLWRGEWWRIWGTSLHHGGIAHLLMNMWALVLLGRLVEQRMGTIPYACFIVGGIGFSGMAQSLAHPHFVGLSGFLCALVGWLIARRDHDPTLAQGLTTEWVWTTLGMVFLMIPLDWLGVLNIGNLAHLGGLLYGLILGKWVTFRYAPSAAAARSVAVLVGVHLLLIPGVWFACHPVWSADYYWFLAGESKDDAQRMKLWRTALKLNPELVELYGNLAKASMRQNEPLEAWKVSLQGLHRHPADESLFKLARAIGIHFRRESASSSMRESALQILRSEFGPQSARWEERLLASEHEMSLRQLLEQSGVSPYIVPGDPRSNHPEQTQPSEPAHTPRNKPQPINPQAPDSAAEGESA